MKKHCRIIAGAGMILGIAGLLYMTWLYKDTIWGVLLVWAFGGPAIYTVYVMWASLAEMLERLERLERNVPGDAVGEEVEEPEEMGQALGTDEGTEEGVICPRCGNVQRIGEAVCTQCGMSLR